MSPAQDILWKYYEEELKQAINHESSRSSITNLILIITGVIISIITYDGNINYGDSFLAIFLMIIGLYGCICNAKYYERFHFHYSRSKGYRRLLEEQYPNIDFNASRASSDIDNINRFKIISRIRLNWLWIILNLMISLFGLVLTIKIFYN